MQVKIYVFVKVEGYKYTKLDLLRVTYQYLQVFSLNFHDGWTVACVLD